MIIQRFNDTLKLAALSMLALISFTATAQSFNLHRSIQIELVPIEYRLAKKIMPIVRTYVSTNGHIAHVAGANYMVIADSPESLPKLTSILTGLTEANFDPQKLKQDLQSNIKTNHARPMITREIKLNRLAPQVVVHALNALTSDKGKLIVGKTKNTVELTENPLFFKEIERLIGMLDQGKDS